MKVWGLILALRGALLFKATCTYAYIQEQLPNPNRTYTCIRETNPQPKCINAYIHLANKTTNQQLQFPFNLPSH
jgi:hypothetical protein